MSLRVLVPSYRVSDKGPLTSRSRRRFVTIRACDRQAYRHMDGRTSCDSVVHAVRTIAQ